MVMDCASLTARRSPQMPSLSHHLNLWCCFTPSGLFLPSVARKLTTCMFGRASAPVGHPSRFEPRTPVPFPNQQRVPMKTLIQAAFAVSLLSVTAASAHVTLEKAEAPPKSTYKAVFRVPHGCGQSATTAITVTIPEGVVAAKPMPKAGWKLEIAKGAYAKSYKYYSSQLNEGPKQITWSGGTLPDDLYDEFTVSVYFTDAISAGTNVFFPVEQTCEKGVNHWTSIASEGETAKAGTETAPSVKIVDVQQAAGSAARPWPARSGCRAPRRSLPRSGRAGGSAPPGSSRSRRRAPPSSRSAPRTGA